MDSVEHILQLADEYQMQSIVDLCATCLKYEPKTKRNAMAILLLAQRYHLQGVRESCYELLKDNSIKELQEREEFDELDAESLREILIPRMQRLEKCLEELYPKFAKIVDSAIELCVNNKCPIKLCATHFLPSGATFHNLYTRVKDCIACGNMVAFVETTSKPTSVGMFGNLSTAIPTAGVGLTFSAPDDLSIVRIVKEMSSLVSNPVAIKSFFVN